MHTRLYTLLLATTSVFIYCNSTCCDNHLHNIIDYSIWTGQWTFRTDTEQRRPTAIWTGLWTFWTGPGNKIKIGTEPYWKYFKDKYTINIEHIPKTKWKCPKSMPNFRKCANRGNPTNTQQWYTNNSIAIQSRLKYNKSDNPYYISLSC